MCVLRCVCRCGAVVSPAAVTNCYVITFSLFTISETRLSFPAGDRASRKRMCFRETTDLLYGLSGCCQICAFFKNMMRGFREWVPALQSGV